MKFNGLVKPASPQVERIIKRLLQETKEGEDDYDAGSDPLGTFLDRFRSLYCFSFESDEDTTKAGEFWNFYCFLQDCKNILLYVSVYIDDEDYSEDLNFEFLIDATEEELLAAYPESDAS